MTAVMATPVNRIAQIGRLWRFVTVSGCGVGLAIAVGLLLTGAVNDGRGVAVGARVVVGATVAVAVAVAVGILVGVGVNVEKPMTASHGDGPSAGQSSAHSSTIRSGNAQSPLSLIIT